LGHPHVERAQVSRITQTGIAARSGAAISSNSRAPTERASILAGLLLVVFMRLLAGLWALQGLLEWSAILLPRESLLENLPLLRGAAVIFFAVFDLVAAVGLWLAAPWGGVIWLLGALAQIVVAIALPGFFSMFWVAANLTLIAIYFVLNFEASYPGAAFANLRQWRG
jgi:Family of unknown function (DUF6163)